MQEGLTSISGQEAEARSAKIVKEMLTKSMSEVPNLYSTWSETYEQDLLNMSHSYTHPQKIAKIAEQYLSDKGCRILDVCAGTGLGGMALHQLGFTNIDAIDGSKGMLEQAAKKQVYRQIFEELICEDRVKSVEPGSYDAIVTSGSFVPSHLGPGHLKPLIGIIKQGGIFCMALKDEYLRTDYLAGLEPTMDQLEAAGVWCKIESGVMEHYYNDLPGKYYVYKKL